MSTQNVALSPTSPDLGYSQKELVAMTPGQRLRLVRQQKYELASDAARALGIETGTYRAHEANRGTFRHLPRYAEFFGVPLDFLATGKIASVSGTETKHQPIVDSTLEGLTVKGFVHAGVWQETYTPEGDTTVLPIAGVVGYPQARQFALQIKGDSINRRAPDGSFAVCLEWHGPLSNNDVVIFERRKNGFFQSTVKIVKLRNESVELWPDSDSPAHQEPLVVRKSEIEEGEEFFIRAKVLCFVISP